MPLRVIIAYMLIALVIATLTIVYRYLTRERRAYRAYRRAKKKEAAARAG